MAVQYGERVAARPILLLGSSGMLGRAFVQVLEARAPNLSRPSSREIDLNDLRDVHTWVKPGALVIDCAAWTDVDGAEAQEAAALRLNGDAVAELGKACANVGATLVHFSTDYVFDGQASEPYAPGAPRRPINAYGRSKCAGEIALEATDAEWLLIRTSWLYASWGKNFLRTIASKARQVASLRVVDDQYGRPTWVTHLAESALGLVELGAHGVFHVTDGGPACSWYEFAREIVASTSPTCQVTPCSTSEYPRPAQRPGYSVLQTHRAEALLGPFPDWREHTRRVCQELLPTPDPASVQ